MPDPRSHPHRHGPLGDGDPCARASEDLEAFLDEALDPAARRRLEVHLDACASCAAELVLARRVRDELHRLPALACPPAVTRRVLARIERPSPLRRLLGALGLPPAAPTSAIWRPALAAAVLAAVAVSLWTLPGGPFGPARPDAAQVQKAEAEVKLALAYLGRIGEKAGTTAGVDVLEQRVVEPMTRSIAGALAGPPDGIGLGQKGADHED